MGDNISGVGYLEVLRTRIDDLEERHLDHENRLRILEQRERVCPAHDGMVNTLNEIKTAIKVNEVRMLFLILIASTAGSGLVDILKSLFFS